MCVCRFQLFMCFYLYILSKCKLVSMSTIKNTDIMNWRFAQILTEEVVLSNGWQRRQTDRGTLSVCPSPSLQPATWSDSWIDSVIYSQLAENKWNVCVQCSMPSSLSFSMWKGSVQWHEVSVHFHGQTHGNLGEVKVAIGYIEVCCHSCFPQPGHLASWLGHPCDLGSNKLAISVILALISSQPPLGMKWLNNIFTHLGCWR